MIANCLVSMKTKLYFFLLQGLNYQQISEWKELREGSWFHTSICKCSWCAIWLLLLWRMPGKTLPASKQWAEWYEGQN